MRPPNVLVVCIDCLRSDKLCCAGRLFPHLYSLIQRGALFPNVMAVSTTTSPSVASILTGTYPFEHGIQSLVGYQLNPSVQTFPERLREHGYYTHAMVTGPLVKALGLNRGFDRYDIRETKENLHSDWKRQLIETIRSFRSPWMLFLHLWELHLPRVVTERFKDASCGTSSYERALSGMDYHFGDILQAIDPSNTVIMLTGDHGESIAEDWLKRILVRLGEDRRSRRFAQYVGKGLDRLRQYIPWGPEDHYGPGFRNEFEGHGYHIFDFMIKVPALFVNDRFFPAGKRIDLQVSQVDCLPTLYDALGMKWPNRALEKGRSLMPLISDASAANWEELTYSQASGKILTDQKNWLIGLRTPEWKYVQSYFSNQRPDELYNLKRDPKELINVIHRYPSVAQRFRIKISDFIKSRATIPMGSDEAEALSERLKSLGYL